MREMFSQYFLEKRQQTFGQSAYLFDCRFEADNGQAPQLCHVRKYVSHWNEMHQKGLGLLLWGPTGTGKTFAAACVANAFLESREQFTRGVIMTDFGTVLRRNLAATPQQRQEELERFLSTDLLILDDFGTERQTEYAQEQVYHIINGRYNRRGPMIVTTNMTLQQLKAPETIQQQRIFDRLLEMCIPICFDGSSLRREKASEHLEFFRQLGETVAS